MTCMNQTGLYSFFGEFSVFEQLSTIPLAQMDTLKSYNTNK